MKSANFKKTIVGIIIVTMLSVQVLLPLQASAAVASWDTPNSGSSSFGISASDFLNPKLLVSVIGCTGVVNIVATATLNLAKTIVKKLIDPAVSIPTHTALVATSAAVTADATAITGAAVLTTGQAVPGIPVADVGSRTALLSTNALLVALVAHGVSSDAIKVAQTASQTQDASTAAFREECLNGIAVALAKQQLEKITRSTLNWVGAGFNGNPLFVQNVDSFMNNITNDILNRENKFFGDPLNRAKYPYGQLYVQSQVNAYKSQNNLDSALQQNLTNYLVPGATPQSFASDFSQGGWNGWLALTQNPQNNPLGFVMVKSQDTADKAALEKTNTNNKLIQGGGYLPQQKCIVRALDGTRTLNKLNQLQANVVSTQVALSNYGSSPGAIPSVVDTMNTAYNQARGALAAANKDPANQDCTSWQVVTPGSAIRDKVTKTLNSPETQLELVHTINDALTYLFTALLSRFQSQGLSSLVNGPFDDVSDGFTANDLTDANGNSLSTNRGGQNSSGYFGFDITKDLAAIIEKQKEYLLKAVLALATAKEVLPTLGELDYCIPGPNLNWIKNSGIDTISNPQFSGYNNEIQSTFGDTSPMQTKGSSGYLQMAQSGLNVTKDLPTDEIIINQQVGDLTDGNADANANITTLTEIKRQVDVIVAAATRRRDAQRTKDGLPPISSCVNTQ
jgi:hypothetical protein